MTAIGAVGLNAIYPVVAPWLGAANPTSFLLADTLALAAVSGLFLAAFLAVVGATHLLSTSGVPLRVRAGQYAVTLLPISLWIIAAPIVVEPGTLPPAGSLP